ncbi:BEL1-like homeodomain protein 7 [Impatiens glandulifera]|uniref:BEL1-like homeodomain protein 7 n=1 Tax=Impatiens glandulifera TaxID=253017 RepID=UPI001FB0703C|nr:BEL1-like homeodomain protein 7 [Impatiens glandulifera]
MATYFSGSSNQRDDSSSPMLYNYTEPSPPSVLPANLMMMMYMGPQNQGGSTDAQPQPHDLQALAVDHDLGSWKDERNEILFMHPLGTATNLLQDVQNLQGQGLSLSLSTQMQQHLPSMGNYPNPLSSFLGPNGSGKLPANIVGGDHSSDLMKISVPNSKYLKVAQQLLDEVVNVRKALSKRNCDKETPNDAKQEGTQLSSVVGDEEPTTKCELSAAEKQELQNKLAKLFSMLDEVDTRYKQYYHQMQIVASSFDAVVGPGAAKPYTSLALQTISRHFRSLRDSITGQIKLTRKSLGELDSTLDGGIGKGIGISRLRYVDQQLRQQRALQQMGIMQQHAWRPQRGLPESSVTILRAWLFEHFLHPYPKDSDKSLLARQTGLTRSQVSNWFINARVRLWKPMVEEMYKEEFGEAEMDSSSASEDRAVVVKDTQQQQQQQQGSNENKAADNIEMDDRIIRYSSQAEEVSFRFATIGSSSSSNSPQYQITEMGRSRYGSGNGVVSLSLGLQHCEDGSHLPIPMDTHHHHHHGFADFSRDLLHNNVSSMVAETECMDSRTRQQRFGVPFVT